MYVFRRSQVLFPSSSSSDKKSLSKTAWNISILSQDAKYSFIVFFIGFWIVYLLYSLITITTIYDTFIEIFNKVFIDNFSSPFYNFFSFSHFFPSFFFSPSSSFLVAILIESAHSPKIHVTVPRLRAQRRGSDWDAGERWWGADGFSHTPQHPSVVTGRERNQGDEHDDNKVNIVMVNENLIHFVVYINKKVSEKERKKLSHRPDTITQWPPPHFLSTTPYHYSLHHTPSSHSSIHSTLHYSFTHRPLTPPLTVPPLPSPPFTPHPPLPRCGVPLTVVDGGGDDRLVPAEAKDPTHCTPTQGERMSAVFPALSHSITHPHWQWGKMIRGVFPSPRSSHSPPRSRRTEWAESVRVISLPHTHGMWRQTRHDVWMEKASEESKWLTHCKHIVLFVCLLVFT